MQKACLTHIFIVSDPKKKGRRNKNKNKNRAAGDGSFNRRQSSVVKGNWRPSSRSSHKQSRLVLQVPLEILRLLAAIRERERRGGS